MRVDTPPYDGYLFWISMQAMINYMALQGVTRFGEPREIPGLKPWIDELFDMSIVHINEPGKDRNLTKASS
jgi:hypothetical protein